MSQCGIEDARYAVGRRLYTAVAADMESNGLFW